MTTEINYAKFSKVKLVNLASVQAQQLDALQKRYEQTCIKVKEYEESLKEMNVYAGKVATKDAQLKEAGKEILILRKTTHDYSEHMLRLEKQVVRLDAQLSLATDLIKNAFNPK